jgi:hypothetical protein
LHHRFTETAPIREAFDELRAELGTDELPLEDLVIRGAATISRVATLSPTDAAFYPEVRSAGRKHPKNMYSQPNCSVERR